MRPSVENGECRFIGRSSICRSCRAGEKFRLSINAPEVCPHGVTADSMPKVFRTKWRKKGCGTCKPVEVAYPAQ